MEGTGEDYNIIEVHQHARILGINEEFVHSPLKGSRGIAEALRHFGGFKKAFNEDEGAFFSVCGGEINLSISTGEIHGREIIVVAEFTKEIINASQG